MIRGFFRLVGLLLLAAAFILLVYDGARSIADQMLRLTRFGDLWNEIHQASQRALGESVAPWVWSAVTRAVLEQPAFAVLGVLGLVLMVLFRPRKRLIGYVRD